MASQETSNNDEEEFEAEQLLRSPKKAHQRSARKRIMSDDEQEFEGAAGPASQSGRDNRRSIHASSPLAARTDPSSSGRLSTARSTGGARRAGGVAVAEAMMMGVLVK